MIDINKDKATVKLTLAEYEALIKDNEKGRASLEKDKDAFQKEKAQYEDGLTSITITDPNWRYRGGYNERKVFKTRDEILKLWRHNFVTEEIKKLEDKLQEHKWDRKHYIEDTSVWEFIKMKRGIKKDG